MGWRGEKLAKRRKRPHLPKLTRVANNPTREDTADARGTERYAISGDHASVFYLLVGRYATQLVGSSNRQAAHGIEREFEDRGGDMRGFLARKNLRGEFLLSPKPGSQAGRAFVAVVKVGFAPRSSGILSVKPSPRSFLCQVLATSF